MELSHWRRLVVENLIDEGRECLSPEGPAAGQQLVEQNAQREEVAPAVEGFPSNLLRRQIQGAADDRTGGRQGCRLIGQASNAKVPDLRASRSIQKDVAGLHIPMHDSVLVGVSQTFRYLPAKSQDLSKAQSRRAVHAFQEIAAVDVFEGQKEEAVLFSHIEEGHDIGMEELARCLSFSQQTRLAFLDLRLGLVSGRNDLDGQLAADSRILGEKDLAHGASSEASKKAIAPEGVSRLQRSSRFTPLHESKP